MFQEYFKYWPDTNCAYSDMDVALNSEVANGNIITRKIKVTSSKVRNTLTFRSKTFIRTNFAIWLKINLN